MSVVWKLILDVTIRMSCHMNCIYILSGYSAVDNLQFLEN